MKRMLPVLAVCAVSVALAAPPPGHPSPDQAMVLLTPKKIPEAAELPNQGKVLSRMDANDFTYIEVDRAGAVEWIAAPKMEIAIGSTIRYEDGALMTDFYSKLLKRTFPRVIFVGHVAVTGQ